MSKTTPNNIIKSALWNSYNHICFYCKQPLDWDDLHIDHLIPESYIKGNLLDTIKEEYKLPEDFEINGLINLVPAHAKCNLRKSDQLFEKEAIIFYIQLTSRTLPKIGGEIAIISRRKNRGQLLARLQSALDNNLINFSELKDVAKEAEANDWNTAEIKLPWGIEFIDKVFDAFYLNGDYSGLLNEPLKIGEEIASLELTNENEETITVSTLKEWIEATDKGFYPPTTYGIKMSANFLFLKELLTALKIARMPKVTFIEDNWTDVDQLDNLSSNVLYDPELKITYEKSIGSLLKEGKITLNDPDHFRLRMELDGIETSLVEIFRADFNDDGIEEVFVRGWTRAVEGTMGFGFTAYLSRSSKNSLIRELSPF